MSRKIAVIGDGGWGTALALLLHGNGHAVTAWGPFPEYVKTIAERRRNEKFLPGIQLPPEIEWTTTRADAVAGADVAVLAVPSRFYADTIGSFAGLIPDSCLLVNVAKGLDENTHERMSRVAERVLGRAPVAVLSGPSHAEEVARGIPTAVVVACDQPEPARRLQSIFAAARFRVYTSDDTLGVELGGTLKNVIAIAVGVSDGLGFGDNTRAALITRGLAEITRLGSALGARPTTFSGLSGMGDLIVTCTSRHSRNRGVGERIGRGETVDQVLGSTAQATEGVWNCAAARTMARELGIEVPITEEVYSIVHEAKPPADAVASLLERNTRPE